jgi:hypothetical protein
VSSALNDPTSSGVSPPFFPYVIFCIPSAALESSQNSFKILVSIKEIYFLILIVSSTRLLLIGLSVGRILLSRAFFKVNLLFSSALLMIFSSNQVRYAPHHTFLIASSVAPGAASITSISSSFHLFSLSFLTSSAFLIQSLEVVR